MSGPHLRVRTPGLLTTVQDLGRWGWQHLGVPVGGAMDAGACRRANRLVGNQDGAAVLEVTISGPVLVATAPATVALSGGTFEADVDGRAVPADVPVQMPSGGVLTIGHCHRGARLCVAVAGGIETPLVLGSRSTTPGVFDGRPLRAGDLLPIGSAGRSVTAIQSLRRPSLGAAELSAESVSHDPPVVRVLEGPDLARLGRTVLDALCADAYTLDAASNRMGYRLLGPTISAPALSLPSSGTVMGMLQLLPSGAPLLLMADRQTTGGYPVPAVVIEADLGLVAQLAPGDACRFAVCSRADAVAARIAQEREWPRE